MKRFICLTFISVLLSSVQFQNTAFAVEQVNCAGCKTEYFLIKELTNVLNSQMTDMNIKPAQTGNKKAVELMVAGEVNFAFTCKNHLKLAAKFQLPAEKTASWVSVSFAHDPIVIVSNPDCNTGNLTMEQLCGIFNGTITNWKDISGKDLEIKVGYLDSSVESGVVTVFKETSIGESNDLTEKATQLKAPSNLGNFCKSTPGAIVFMGLNSYKQEYGNIMKINDVIPNSENVKNTKYPLSVTYHIIYDQKNDNAAKKLLQFIASEQGQQIVNSMMVASEPKEIK